MPYYMGDPYGMARGDPGFLSFIGGLAKRVVGAVVPGAGAVMAGVGALAKRTTPVAMTRIGQASERVAGIVRRRPGAAIGVAAGAGAGMAGIAAEVMGGRGRPGRMARMPGMRRRRRMHVTNMKALRRAIRRAHGFAKIARRVLHFVAPKAPRGRPLFKHKRKARM